MALHGTSDGNKLPRDRESGRQNGSRHQRAEAGPETTRRAKGEVVRAKRIEVDAEFLLKSRSEFAYKIQATCPGIARDAAKAGFHTVKEKVMCGEDRPRAG